MRIVLIKYFEYRIHLNIFYNKNILIMEYIFIEYFLIYFLLLFLLVKILIYYIEHSYKLPISWNYYAKVYIGTNLSVNEKVKITATCRKVAIDSISHIPDYPFMNGDEMDNKIFTFIYNKNDEPVALNVYFLWSYKNTNVCHLGLYLVSKEYQKNGLQKYLGMIQKYNIIKLFPVALISDIGRSPSAFKLIDTFMHQCNPSMKTITPAFKSKSQEFAIHFYNNYAKYNCGFDKEITFDSERMVIHPSWGPGALSRDIKYNKFVESVCPTINHEMLIIAEYNFFKSFIFQLFIIIIPLSGMAYLWY